MYGLTCVQQPVLVVKRTDWIRMSMTIVMFWTPLIFRYREENGTSRWCEETTTVSCTWILFILTIYKREEMNNAALFRFVSQVVYVINMYLFWQFWAIATWSWINMFMTSKYHFLNKDIRRFMENKNNNECRGLYSQDYILS